jgi:hypothetical protein
VALWGHKFALQAVGGAARSRATIHHGQSEKETSSEDEQAQAQKALEIKPPQEADMAEVICAQDQFSVFSFSSRRIQRRDFFLLGQSDRSLPTGLASPKRGDRNPRNYAFSAQETVNTGFYRRSSDVLYCNAR